MDLGDLQSFEQLVEVPAVTLQRFLAGVPERLLAQALCGVDAATGKSLFANLSERKRVALQAEIGRLPELAPATAANARMLILRVARKVGGKPLPEGAPAAAASPPPKRVLSPEERKQVRMRQWRRVIGRLQQENRVMKGLAADRRARALAALIRARITGREGGSAAGR